MPRARKQDALRMLNPFLHRGPSGGLWIENSIAQSVFSRFCSFRAWHTHVWTDSDDVTKFHVDNPSVDGATVVPSWTFSNLADEVGILLYEKYLTQ